MSAPQNAAQQPIRLEDKKDSLITYSLSKGIFFLMFGVFTFTGVNALFKFLSQPYEPVQVIFFRHLWALPICLLLMYFEHGKITLKTSCFGLHLIRSFYGLLSLVTLFTALALLPLAEVTLLMFSTSLFLTLLSGFYLGEWPHSKTWTAVVVGFIGIYIISPIEWGDHSDLSWSWLGVLCGLGAGLCDALLMLSGRQMSSKGQSGSLMSVYYSLLIGTAAGILMYSNWKTPNYNDFIILSTIGLAGGWGQYCMVTAYRYAPATILAPFIYTSILWAVLYDFLLFVPSWGWNLLIGGVLIILSGLYVTSQQRASR